MMSPGSVQIQTMGWSYLDPVWFSSVFWENRLQAAQ